MFDWIDPLYGWLGLGTISVAGLFVIAYFVPPLRNAAIAAAGVIMAAAAVYAKGNRDRAKLEQKRKDEAVRKVKVKYDEIDKRKDTPDSVDKRLRDGNF